jgi:predicted  nucleic acid-binding Zn-ribbon protein
MTWWGFPMSSVNLARDRLEKAISRIDTAIEQIAKGRAEAEQMEKDLAAAQKRAEELKTVAQSASERIDTIIGRLERLHET